ncbi:MAG TPA: type II toxin-antitoxin system VapC family toxin [Candidatus Sulfotelmatobacter sp.]|nr:type II toxin-antitoxin system VapC family toxin [Candidatus Sulfotelmatobacter sp.]
MKTALDSDILSCLWSNEPSASRVEQELRKAHAQGAIVVCAPVYVELLAHPLASRGFVEQFLSETGIVVEFLMGEPVWRKCADGFAAYAQRRRRSGGAAPRRLLADFIIAAHAMLQADCLFTLDPSRYQRDFPNLRLI